MRYLRFIAAFIFLIFISVNLSAQVEVRPITTSTLNSENLSSYAPLVMIPGESYSVYVTMKNTGYMPWEPRKDQLNQFYLKPFGTTDRPLSDWGIGSVTLDEVVLPGENHRFEFIVTAPWSPGYYNFQWRMAEGNDFFGESSEGIIVNVSNDATVPPLDVYSTYFSQSVPNEMIAGNKYPVTVTVTNTGKTAWTPGYQWLTFYDSQMNIDRDLWGIKRAGLNQEVLPGESATFNFTVTAPARPGVYNFQWRMAQANGAFGELTDGVRINVVGGNNARDADAVKSETVIE